MLCSTGTNQLHLLKGISDALPTTLIITKHISEMEKCSLGNLFRYRSVTLPLKMQIDPGKVEKWWIIEEFLHLRGNGRQMKVKRL